MRAVYTRLFHSHNLHPRTLARSLIALGVSAFLAGGINFACSGADTDTQSTALTSRNDLVYWTANAKQIPICFYLNYSNAVDGTSGVKDPAAREAFRCALERGWQGVANVDFSTANWVLCPTSGSTRYVPYVITNGGGGVTGDWGMVVDGNYILPSNIPAHVAGFVGTGNPPQFDMEFQHVVLHEVGHTLGFIHEMGNTNNRGPDGDVLRWSDGGAQWCEMQGEAITPLNLVADLTPLDKVSVMQMNYCQTSLNGLTWQGDLGNGVMSPLVSDIYGVRQIYGQRALTADSDGDGTPDYADNCPYVRNPGQYDANKSAEVTLALRNGYSGSPNTTEGMPPQPADTVNGLVYIQHFHDWYPGNSCDTTSTTRTQLTGPDPSHLDYAGCIDWYLGPNSYSSYDPYGNCPMSVSSGHMEMDSYVSVPTGLPWDQTGSALAQGAGTSRPAVCYCPYADSASPADRALCQSAFNCDYARDDHFPTLTLDGTYWKRATQEHATNNGWAPGFIENNNTFTQPPPCFSPAPTDAHWNPFHAWTVGWTQMADTWRLGLGTGVTTLTAVVWTHVTNYAHKPPPTDLANHYIGITTTYDTGVRIHQGDLTAPTWWWYGWELPAPDPRSVGIDGLTVRPTGAGGSGAVAVRISEQGQTIATADFTPSALATMAGVASGAQELIVADDNAVQRYESQNVPSALLVDTGTTRMRAALSKSYGPLTAQTITVPSQSTTSLRSYSARSGQLYSLEAAAGGFNLVARDVASAIAGSATSTSVTLTGAAPHSPLAMVWVVSTNSLYVADKWTSPNRLRLLRVDATTGVCTELWNIGAGGRGYPLLSTFLTMTGAGDLILSYNLATTWEAIAMRPDGQPFRSLAGSGVLHRGVVSDGAGFTLLTNETPTENQPNVAWTFVGRESLGHGLCGTSWFQNHVGDQTGAVLGNPSFECTP